MKPRASAMRRGRRTFARWKARRREWRLRAPKSAAKKPRTKMPLIVVANSPDKDAALAGLERWKSKHAEVAELLAVDDVLVDSMRGTSSTWTRIRVNLRHVPEEHAAARRKRPTRTTIRRASGAPCRARKESVSAALSGRSAKIAVSSCGGTTSSWA